MATSPKLYLSKVSTFYICPRKYFYTYHLNLDMPGKAEALEYGAAFHSCMEIFFQHGYVAADRYLMTFPEEMRKELALHVYKTIHYFKIQEEAGEFLLLSSEKTIQMPIESPFFSSWSIKTDLLYRKKNGNWVGDFKTTKSWGPSVSAYYHKSLQTLTYGMVQRQVLEVEGTEIFILTRTKEPRFIPETILLTNHDLDRAKVFISESVEQLSLLEEKAQGEEFLYPRNQCSCTPYIGGECIFKDLCFAPASNLDYKARVLSTFEIRDPDAHLNPIQIPQEVLNDNK